MAGRSRNDSDTRRLLLRCATELLGKGGEEAITISGVAHQAGVTRGTVYHHFRDRPALVAETREFLMDQVGRAALDEGPMSERFNRVAQLMWSSPEFARSHARDLIDQLRDHPSYARDLERAKRYKALGILRPNIDVEIATCIGISVWMMASFAIKEIDDVKKRNEEARKFVRNMRQLLFYGIYDPEKEDQMR